MTVSFDGNFRSTLWNWEEARDFCTLCLPYVDVLFGIQQKIIQQMTPDRKSLQGLCREISEYQMHCKTCAFAHSCSENSLMAYLWLNRKIYESKRLTFHILDRVKVGIIYALMNEYTPEDIVNFGVAASMHFIVTNYR